MLKARLSAGAWLLGDHWRYSVTLEREHDCRGLHPATPHQSWLRNQSHYHRWQKYVLMEVSKCWIFDRLPVILTDSPDTRADFMMRKQAETFSSEILCSVHWIKILSSQIMLWWRPLAIPPPPSPPSYIRIWRITSLATRSSDRYQEIIAPPASSIFPSLNN